MIANVSALVTELKARAETGKPVTMGLAGAGQMGTDIVVQLSLMPGLRLGAISEVNAGRAVDAALLAGYRREQLVMAKSAADIEQAIERGRLAVTDDLSALVAAGRIDVVIDATGNSGSMSKDSTSTDSMSKDGLKSKQVQSKDAQKSNQAQTPNAADSKSQMSQDGAKDGTKAGSTVGAAPSGAVNLTTEQRTTIRKEVLTSNAPRGRAIATSSTTTKSSSLSRAL